MNSVIKQMLEPYQCKTPEQYKHALKEIIQELALLGLWRTNFFDHAAFYGGTALRILFGLNRFSEDMDFSLLTPDPSFSIKAYEKGLESELHGFGLTTQIETKVKTQQTAIQSAFLKANTLVHLLTIGVPIVNKKTFHHQDSIHIKIEVDTNPPPGFQTTLKYLEQPSHFFVRTYSEPDLFSGKMHALLFRAWKNRIKGRDWYDFTWFAGRKTPIHLAYLEIRMRQSGQLGVSEHLTESSLKQMLVQKIESINLEFVKADVLGFLADTRVIDVWSKDFFMHLVDQMLFV